MPTTLTSNNITAVQFKESASPGTPASGYGRLYVSTSGVLRFVDDAGSDTAIIGSDIRAIVPGGRLTLTTATAITTSDVTAAGTLYYTPYIHNIIGLYDGTSVWNYHTFTERSLSLTLTSGKNYDVFLYNNSGTLTLELSAAWTNDTTRADALTTQDGVTVKSGATTRRWLGTIRASGANTTEDSKAKRFVWNAYNRVARPILYQEATNSWTYNSATVRAWNNNTTPMIEIVVGNYEPVTVLAIIQVYNAAFQQVVIGVGVSSTTTNSAKVFGGNPDNGKYGQAQGYLEEYLAPGYSYLQALEANQAAGNTTFYGDGGAATVLQFGMTGALDA